MTLAQTGAEMQAASLNRPWLDSVRDEFESHLEDKIVNMPGVSSGLHDAMKYALLGGGKRLRACLLFAVGDAVGTAPALLMDAACAMEAMHAYSLVHDDLPCMDDDVLRRGKPTCHVKFGEATALLAGDALQTTAFQWLLESKLQPDAVRLKQATVLAAAAGAQGMANGQAIDLAHVGRAMNLAELKHMHARKTGDLILASVRLAYVSQAGLSSQMQAGLEDYAKTLGLAYQVIDDILDVESTSEQLGKTSGKDALSNKPTMVSLMGLSAAKQLLSDLRNSALSACALCGVSESHPMATLVDLITDRKS